MIVCCQHAAIEHKKCGQIFYSDLDVYFYKTPILHIGSFCRVAAHFTFYSTIEEARKAISFTY